MRRRSEIIANVALLVVHVALLATCLLDPALATKHRHDVATLYRVVLFLMMAHVRCSAACFCSVCATVAAPTVIVTTAAILSLC